MAESAIGYFNALAALRGTPREGPLKGSVASDGGLRANPPGWRSIRQSLGARSGPKRPQLGGYLDGVALPDVVGVPVRASDHQIQQSSDQDDGQPDRDDPPVQEGTRVAGLEQQYHCEDPIAQREH